MKNQVNCLQGQMWATAIQSKATIAKYLNKKSLKGRPIEANI